MMLQTQADKMQKDVDKEVAGPNKKVAKRS